MLSVKYSLWPQSTKWKVIPIFVNRPAHIRSLDLIVGEVKHQRYKNMAIWLDSLQASIMADMRIEFTIDG